MDAADVLADLGRRIAELREAQGLTQDALAERAGIDPTHLRKIEAESLPAVGVTRLVGVANALGCARLQELFEAPASREPRGPGRPKKKP